jgi:autoinducer 2-degrading protein
MASPLAASSAVGGKVLIVTVEIDHQHLDEFKQVISEDAAGSRTRENGGCYRFDVIELEPGGNKFIFYEVYKDEDAIAFHKNTPHFKLWSDFKAKYTPSAVLSQTVVKGDVVY